MAPTPKDPRDRKGKNTCVRRFSDNDMEKIRIFEGVRSNADAKKRVNARIKAYTSSLYRLDD